MNRGTILDITAATVDAINRWEPRFRVEKVTPTKVEPGVVELTLIGKYQGTTVEIPIGQPPLITSGTAVDVLEGTPFSYQITATNSPTGYFVIGGLPAGLTLNATTGLISGTTGFRENHVITVGAKSPYGSAAQRVYLRAVQPEPGMVYLVTDFELTLGEEQAFTLVGVHQVSNWSLT
jgi:hypothetical protein